MIRTALFFLTLAVAFPSHAKDRETAYDRVVTSGVLRCGYGSWEPGVYKDQTGAMKGVYVDLITEAARMAKIKVEWTQEVDWGQIPEALRSGKVDAFCSGMANDAGRAKQLGYTVPMTYWSFDIVVRADDTRFPSGRPLTTEDLNKPEFSTAYTEGDVLETIKQTELPNVKGVPLPPLGTPADNIMNVLTKKTDFVIFPRVMLQTYEKANGKGKLRLLKMKTPIRVYGNVIAVDAKEQPLINFLNAAIDELVNSSSYERILAPYDKDYPDAFIRVQKPYTLKD